MTDDRRRTVGTGALLILLGMILAVSSAGLTWRIEKTQAPGGIPAFVVVQPTQQLSGFALPMGWLKVGWAVVICAVACGAILMFPPRDSDRKLFLRLHTGLASLILILALVYIGPFPGVALALSGGLLLVAGGVLNYR